MQNPVILMDILLKIVEHKRKVVSEKKERVPASVLEEKMGFNRLPVSLVNSLKKNRGSGIVAEFKRRSPSKDAINLDASVEDVARGYEKAGACAVSVLTDTLFFGGTTYDLETVRSSVQLPVLRKDFIIDEYQVLETKAIGADVILLIASILTPEECRKFGDIARSIGLEVLMEVREREEIVSHMNEFVDVVGVNNRDLKTFEVNINRSLDLAPHIPEGISKISESGLSEIGAIRKLQTAGFDGFLIGESFMRTENPGTACSKFISAIRKEVNS